MCNLYSLTKGQQAIREIFRVVHDRTGNLPSLPGIFPDGMAPVIRTASDGERELTMMRWGFPPPPALGTRPVTNVRNTKSSFWRAWLKPEYRCLVPATSFCEWTDTQPKVTHWFALSAERPLFAFAGIWRPWTGLRKGEEGEHQLYSFLTTEANDTVRPIHAKAMPVSPRRRSGMYRLAHRAGRGSACPATAAAVGCFGDRGAGERQDEAPE